MYGFPAPTPTGRPRGGRFTGRTFSPQRGAGYPPRGYRPPGGQQQQQQLAPAGDIFQGAGTAGYTEEGAQAPIQPDASAMEQAATTTGDAFLGVPTWAWLAGGAAVAAYFAFGRKAAT
jgi:hypothetical protein